MLLDIKKVCLLPCGSCYQVLIGVLIVAVSLGILLLGALLLVVVQRGALAYRAICRGMCNGWARDRCRAMCRAVRYHEVRCYILSHIRALEFGHPQHSIITPYPQRTPILATFLVCCHLTLDPQHLPHASLTYTSPARH